jgi:hypothetical protein
MANKNLTNSTATTQLSSDNSNKIATTSFVKLFSAPFLYKIVKTSAPYTFNFGQFNLSFLSASGTVSNELFFYIDDTSNITVDINISSMTYLGINSSSALILSTTSMTKTSPYLQLSYNVLKANGKCCKGDIFDSTNNINYRFTVLYKSSSNVSYIIEQITF